MKCDFDDHSFTSDDDHFDHFNGMINTREYAPSKGQGYVYLMKLI